MPTPTSARFCGAQRRAPGWAGRTQALTTFFAFLELRHQVEIHTLTGRVVECPIDEMNKPRGRNQAALRIPPTDAEVAVLFAGWREELVTCRKFASAARNYVAAKLMSQVGLRVNEACHLDLGDIKWELGRFGKLHVRVGKGARGSGSRERMVPLINGADRTLRWFIEDVWGHFDEDHTRPGAPLFPSERTNADRTCRRVGDDTLRTGLAEATAAHLPNWAEKLTPHVMRHFCASQLYLSGLDLISIQELLGHSWIASTLNYVHIHRTRIDDAGIASWPPSNPDPSCAVRVRHWRAGSAGTGPGRPGTRG
jgi:site-specific recombinase XerD